MQYETKTILIVIIGAIILLIGSMLGASAVQSSWRLDAAQTSCAQFNPLNGQFEWLEEVENDNAN